MHAFRQASRPQLPGPGAPGLPRGARRQRPAQPRQRPHRAGLVRQLRHGPVGPGRHPRPGGLHAPGGGRAVSRARAHDQCRGRLRHGILRLSWRLEGHPLRPGPGQPGHRRGKAGQPRRSGAHRRHLCHRHRPARAPALDGLLPPGGRRIRQALRDRPGPYPVHGHLCDAGGLAHEALGYHATPDRRWRGQEPSSRQPQSQGPVPLLDDGGRGHGRPACQLSPDPLDVLADGRWCRGRPAVQR